MENNIDKSINRATIGMLGVAIFSTIITFNLLEEKIPIHIGLDGSFSEGSMVPKVGIFLYVGIAIISYVIFQTIIKNNKFVEKFSKTKIKERNKKKYIELTKTFLRIISLEIVVIFAVLQLNIIYSSINGLNKINTIHMIGIGIILISNIIYKNKCKKM